METCLSKYHKNSLVNIKIIENLYTNVLHKLSTKSHTFRIDAIKFIDNGINIDEIIQSIQCIQLFHNKHLIMEIPFDLLYVFSNKKKENFIFINNNLILGNEEFINYRYSSKYQVIIKSKIDFCYELYLIERFSNEIAEIFCNNIIRIPIIQYNTMLLTIYGDHSTYKVREDNLCGIVLKLKSKFINLQIINDGKLLDLSDKIVEYLDLTHKTKNYYYYYIPINNVSHFSSITNGDLFKNDPINNSITINLHSADDKTGENECIYIITKNCLYSSFQEEKIVVLVE